MRVEVVDDVGILWVESEDIKAIMLYKTYADKENDMASVQICTSVDKLIMQYKDHEHAAKVAQQLKEFV
jgi:hypothetical protein